MITRQMMQDMQKLSAFRKTEREVRDSLDPQLYDWREDQATDAQVRYVMYLKKQTGELDDLKWSEREMIKDDLSSMSKGEISELINELKGELGQ